HSLASAEFAKVTFFDHVLFGRFDVNSLGIVEGHVRITDAHNFYAALVSQRQRRDRSDVAKPLHDRGAFFGVQLQNVHGAFNQVHDAAPGGFAAPFGSAERYRLASHNFADAIALVHRIGVHEPGHHLLVGAHVGSHDVGMRTDKGNHFLHVTAG